MIQSPEVQIRIEELRKKASDGTISDAELIEAIQALRQGRIANATASKTSKARKAAEKPDADAMLAELDL